MSPSEITRIGSSVVNSFKYTMLEQFSLFTDKVTKELDGSTNARHIEYQKQRLALACAYIDIIVDFFTETVEGDENFFTYPEIEDIIRHLNRIFGTEYWIEL